MSEPKKKMKEDKEIMDLEKEKIELIRLRIRNKYYDREEILQKVVQEIYEQDFRRK